MIITRPTKQHTLAEPTDILTGRGLYTGDEVMVCIGPAAPNSGINFVYAEASGPGYWLKAQPTGFKVRAHYQSVDDKASVGYTLLTNELGHTVQTPEHFLSGLAGMGIDNANIYFVRSSGSGTDFSFELPLLDGGCKEVVNAIQKAGIVQQDADREFIRIIRPVRVADSNNRYVELAPNDSGTFTVDCTIRVPGVEEDGKLGTVERRAKFDLADRDVFMRYVAPARTLTTLTLAEKLKERMPDVSGTPDNVLIICDKTSDPANYGKPHKSGYKNDRVDEPAWHKGLDVVGDTEGLNNQRIIGSYTSVNGGHQMNNMLMREVYRLGEGVAYERIVGSPSLVPDAKPSKPLVDASLPY
ncbi:MAG: UDP-3-O-acyl-N-acetylglucosamine deacetylase [Alphaproteobacteria bacterium]|nr:UDP-3-O-acyl-N-acetylglucosamine deacetylase [Alphaproteobacteria bacterium]